MLLVRRTMTQVLLQVTSSEIQAICEEELARFRERKTGILIYIYQCQELLDDFFSDEVYKN